jgi:hypothetical protein
MRPWVLRGNDQGQPVGAHLAYVQSRQQGGRFNEAEADLATRGERGGLLGVRHGEADRDIRPLLLQYANPARHEVLGQRL